MAVMNTENQASVPAGSKTPNPETTQFDFSNFGVIEPALKPTGACGADICFMNGTHRLTPRIEWHNEGTPKPINAGRAMRVPSETSSNDSDAMDATAIRPNGVDTPSPYVQDVDATKNSPDSDNESIYEGTPRKALHDRYISLSEALDEDRDMRFELMYEEKREDLLEQLLDHKEEIEKLVAFHCGLHPDQVEVSKMYKRGKRKWMYGSFNICIPVHLKHEDSSSSTLGLRIPFPFKTGEDIYPGNTEEKVRCEAATYIWVHKNCPEIPIPSLRGFGFQGGSSFCEPKSTNFWRRIVFQVRRIFHRFWDSDDTYTSNFIPTKRKVLENYNYILMDWIEERGVRPLAKTFFSPHTQLQATNLQRDISKIMLSLAKVAQPRIGSWTINGDGRITLTNRPLESFFFELENWAIPTDMPRDRTYQNSDTYYLDLLQIHDNRLKIQPNSTFSCAETRAQASCLVILRSILGKYSGRHFTNGPFVMQFTDMHAGNLLVDKDWRIKYVLDLEWACSLPLGDLLAPGWFLHEETPEEPDFTPEIYEEVHDKFAKIFEQEETLMDMPLYCRGVPISRAASLKSALEEGRFWYLNTLRSPMNIFEMLKAHILPRFYAFYENEHVAENISPFWTSHMNSFVRFKSSQHARYIQEVTRIFFSPESGQIHYRSRES